MNDEIVAAWAKYSEARRQHDQVEQQKKNAWAALKAAERELVDAMVEGEVTSWRHANGQQVLTTRRFSIACNAENSDLVERWLVEELGDAEPFKVTKLDKSAVQSHIKRMCEDEGVDLETLPSFLQVSTSPTITVRGWRRDD